MLVVHRSERADRLVEALGDVLVETLADPLEPEVVAVPTRGVERWLTQRLSHRLGDAGAGDGICANLRFPFPGSLVGEATAAACDLGPGDDPWRPERAVWPLVELVDEMADDPDLAPLTAHLRATTPSDGEPDRLRRFSALRHVADLFDHYGVHRPEMVRAWCEGAGGGWQAHLWRLLRARVGVASPAERYATAADRLAGAPELVGLPARFCLFGLTRLPASHLEVLQGLAEARDVHLLLLHPSAALWDALAPHAAACRAGLARSADPTARLPANPLLRSWGRDSREMQLVLGGRGVTEAVHHPLDLPVPATARVLRTIQDAVRGDLAPPGEPSRRSTDPAAPLDARPVLDPADRSLQVHACHGRARQVEVVRDAVSHLLAADPTLEPRDVVVLCPDIEAFAPLVQAVFGTGDTDGAARLRVRLADRSLRQTNQLASVAASLLELGGGRATASEVLDLAARPAVARRFLFDQDELSTLEEWVAVAGVRWGIDSEHRRRWKLGAVGANTWQSGLDRLLLGSAMGGPATLWGDTVPLDGVTGGAVDLAGRWAEMLSRLGFVLAGLRDPQPLRAWAETLALGSELIAAAAPGEEWQQAELRRLLAGAVAEAGPRAETVLTRAEAASLLAARLAGRPTRANFRTGDLTVCTLVPMRSVPHRVVVLLGMDDGVFPRPAPSDGDDLLLEHPEVGDRDARAEDRQLLLDALLAATDHLVVTYAGRDERTNRPRPPAVPVAELLDVVDASFRRDDGRPARESVVVEHPLHSFDERNFRPGGPGRDGAWGFDPVDLAGARSARLRQPAPEWLPEPLPPLAERVVPLGDLVRFFEHPVRAFLRSRLGSSAGRRSSGPVDAVPLELDGLERWAVGDRLLATCLGGVDLERAVAVERSRGQLPPGPLADEVLGRIVPDVEALLGTVAALHLPSPGRSYDVRIELPGGRSLIGSVPGVRGSFVVSCVYSRLSAKHRVAAWVRFLALSAARSELEPVAVSVGRGGGGSQPATMALLPALGTDARSRSAAAIDALGELVELRDLGMREPLPLFCHTSAACAGALRGGRSEQEALRGAEEQWTGGSVIPGERDDPEHVEVIGVGARLAEVGSEPPGPAERAAGWPQAPTRFQVLALRLWEPLLAHERLGPAASVALQAVTVGSLS